MQVEQLRRLLVAVQYEADMRGAVGEHVAPARTLMFAIEERIEERTAPRPCLERRLTIADQRDRLKGSVG